MKSKLILLILIMCVCGTVRSVGCTSAIVSASASTTGRPLLWKHRDTGAPGNFLARVEATDSTHAYVGLFNDGDSLLTEAWMGMNDAGFAIMNTASYNLAPDTAALADQEGKVMSIALATCTTVDDFARLLSKLPRPMGVQANFGVIDATGGAAYFETWDHGTRRFNVSDTPEGYLIRTNFSVSGRPSDGYGYIRYNAARHLIGSAGNISPALFTEGLSRSFYHGLTEHDYLAAGDRYVADRDFIPRDISTASIVIEGVNSPIDPTEMTMWAALGYPPCATVGRVTLDSIPEAFGPSPDGFYSKACRSANALRDRCRPFNCGSGPAYLDLWLLAPIVGRMHDASMEIYNFFDRGL